MAIARAEKLFADELVTQQQVRGRRVGLGVDGVVYMLSGSSSSWVLDAPRTVCRGGREGIKGNGRCETDGWMHGCRVAF